MLLVELPYMRCGFVLLAKKNGKYTRPIVGSIVDFRVEDILKNIPREYNSSCFVGRLPDLPIFNQIGLYVVCRFYGVEDQLIDEKEALELLNEPNFILLPSKPEDDLWDFVRTPWWEFAVVFDGDDGWIKAPKDGFVRENEPHAAMVDERLDSIMANIGKVRVVSPL